MLIFDTHVHTWQLVDNRYEWLNKAGTLLKEDFEINLLEVERKEAGITDGILVQADNNLEDTQWMLKTAQNAGWIKGIIGWLPLMKPQETFNLLRDKYQHQPLIKGVRHLIHDEPDARWLLQDEVIESLEILAQHQLVYEVVAVLPQHIETALAVANKVPGLVMVFDHLSQPPIATQQRFGRWGELMSEAAQHPNFYAKISGLGTTAGVESWGADDLLPYIEFALKHFGVQRCFMGGDWPVSLLAGSYSYTWSQYKIAIDKLLNDQEKAQVYFDNAAVFYRIKN